MARGRTATAAWNGQRQAGGKLLASLLRECSESQPWIIFHQLYWHTNSYGPVKTLLKRETKWHFDTRGVGQRGAWSTWSWNMGERLQLRRTEHGSHIWRLKPPQISDTTGGKSQDETLCDVAVKKTRQECNWGRFQLRISLEGGMQLPVFYKSLLRPSLLWCEQIWTLNLPNSNIKKFRKKPQQFWEWSLHFARSG